MDSLKWLQGIQKLITFLLRYIVAGGSAILAFGLTQKDSFSFMRSGTEISPVLLLLFVSVIGPAIYAIHRAFLHVIIIRSIEFFLRPKNIGDLSLRKFDLILSEQLERWRAASDDWLTTYEPWAAQIHFLYCSAWGIGFALAFAWKFNPSAKNITPILLVGAFLLFAALISDVRLTRLQTERTDSAGAFVSYRKKI